MPDYGDDIILPERGHNVIKPYQGSGMRKRYPAVMPRYEDDIMLPERGPTVIKPYPRRVPRFEKGSQEAKDYMKSIRNNKQGSGFFSKLGKEIKKGAKEAGKILKREQTKAKPHFLENE